MAALREAVFAECDVELRDSRGIFMSQYCPVTDFNHLYLNKYLSGGINILETGTLLLLDCDKKYFQETDFLTIFFSSKTRVSP